MEYFVIIIIYNLILIFMFMTLAWIISLFIGKVSHIDSLWGLGFILISSTTLYLLPVTTFRAYLLVSLTFVWGLRLSIYLTWRSWGKAEDPRYAEWRKEAGKNFWLISLFKVFLLQALFLWLISLVIQFGLYFSIDKTFSPFDIIGLSMWIIGIVIESLADYQLFNFKKLHHTKDAILDKQLWYYSRHPNYFGETLLWWGFYVIVLSVPFGYLTIISPLLITYALTQLTGIKISEANMQQRKPAYAEYMKTTSAFIPWFKKGKEI